jgi:HK97 gp10 family phage protein
MGVFKWFGEKARKAAEDGERIALEEIGFHMVLYIKAHFTNPGSYRKWTSKRPGGGIHWSAHPGMFPAIDTGTLRDSIEYEVTRSFETSKLTVRPTSDVEYAEYLEFGTSKAAPRPFLRPTLAQFEPKIAEIIGRNIMRKIWESL